MGMELRWVGEADLDRVAETRLRCYAKSAGEADAYKLKLQSDARAKPGDYLLAEIDGRAVGTATHMSFNMWSRGGCVPCQGVAWVGAIKTMRRRGGAGTPGIASAVMKEMLRHARERGDVVSALMPFRASYYEHFGYGLVERRQEWTVPIAALPTGNFDTIRFAEPDDFAARADCLRRVNMAGQCSLERSTDHWQMVDKAASDGFAIVDRAGDGPVSSSMQLHHQHVDGKDYVRVAECIYEDAAALRRQLHFLSSLKDQYAGVHLTLPADVPLNRMLNESQLPHRPVNHPVASCHPITRMQVRILDHAKFLESLHVPKESRGAITIAVKECEGQIRRFRLEAEGGRIQCKPTTVNADFECTDCTWAGIACGDLLATDALRFGLANGSNAELLTMLADGPVPFTHEYF